MAPKYMTAEEAAGLIKSYDHVYIQGSTSIPEVLIDAITARASELRGVEMYSAFAIGRRDAPYAGTQRFVHPQKYIHSQLHT